MSEEKNLLTYEERQEIMSMYFANDPTLKMKAMSRMLDVLDERIHYLAHRYFSAYPDLTDDLIQAGRISVLEHMVEYDSRIKLTSYFSFHIKELMQKLVDGISDENRYYSQYGMATYKTMLRLSNEDKTSKSVLSEYLCGLEDILEKHKELMRHTMNNRVEKIDTEDVEE